MPTLCMRHFIWDQTCNDEKMEIDNWFKGFEKGLERLSPEQRSAFLSECGRNCVNGGTLSVYQKLHERAQGDMDTFFQMANELPGVRGWVVEKGRVYRLVFLECTCELCKKGYVTTPLLCECSRQSVIYSLQCLWKEKHFTVTLCHSILRGGTDCEMIIEVESPPRQQAHSQTVNEYAISKARLEDLQEILQLQYLAYQSEATLLGNEDIPPLKQTLDEIIGEYQKGIILKMADTDYQIIGSVRAWKMKGTVYIGKLMIHPDYRHRGYGTRLLSEIEKYYPQKRYELFTSTRSIDNIRLYQKMGYQEFDRRRVDDQLEFVYMEKIV